MDLGDQWMLEYLPGFLPDPLPHLLHTHVLHPHAPLQILKRRTVIFLERLLNMAYPFVSPLLDRAARALHDSPDIVVLGFLAFLLVVALQVLLYVRRLVAWGVRLALRLLFWSVVVALGAAVWRRGLEASARDAVVLGSKVVGYASAIGEVWVREYQRYEAQAQGAGAAAGGRGRGR